MGDDSQPPAKRGRVPLARERAALDRDRLESAMDRAEMWERIDASTAAAVAATPQPAHERYFAELLRNYLACEEAW